MTDMGPDDRWRSKCPSFAQLTPGIIRERWRLEAGAKVATLSEQVRMAVRGDPP